MAASGSLERSQVLEGHPQTYLYGCLSTETGLYIADARLRSKALADHEVDLDAGFRATLVDTKATVFSALEAQRAIDIGGGLAEPLAEFLLERPFSLN